VKIWPHPQTPVTLLELWWRRFCRRYPKRIGCLKAARYMSLPRVGDKVRIYLCREQFGTCVARGPSGEWMIQTNSGISYLYPDALAGFDTYFCGKRSVGSLFSGGGGEGAGEGIAS